MSSHLGYTDFYPHKILSGKEYDKYFSKEFGKHQVIKHNPSTFDTIHQIKTLVLESSHQCNAIAKVLEAKNLEQTVANIEQFIQNHIPYRKDGESNTGNRELNDEELSRPNYIWHNRNNPTIAADCDDISATFPSCILTALGIKHYLRKADYGTGYQHIYTVVPKNQSQPLNANNNMRRSQYLVIDPVLHGINNEKNFYKKHDLAMARRLTVLGAVGNTTKTCAQQDKFENTRNYLVEKSPSANLTNLMLAEIKKANKQDLLELRYKLLLNPQYRIEGNATRIDEVLHVVSTVVGGYSAYEKALQRVPFLKNALTFTQDFSPSSGEIEKLKKQVETKLTKAEQAAIGELLLALKEQREIRFSFLEGTANLSGLGKVSFWEKLKNGIQAGYSWYKRNERWIDPLGSLLFGFPAGLVLTILQNGPSSNTPTPTIDNTKPKTNINQLPAPRPTIAHRSLAGASEMLNQAGELCKEEPEKCQEAVSGVREFMEDNFRYMPIPYDKWLTGMEDMGESQKQLNRMLLDPNTPITPELVARVQTTLTNWKNGWVTCSTKWCKNNKKNIDSTTAFYEKWLDEVEKLATGNQHSTGQLKSFGGNNLSYLSWLGTDQKLSEAQLDYIVATNIDSIINQSTSFDNSVKAKYVRALAAADRIRERNNQNPWTKEFIRFTNQSSSELNNLKAKYQNALVNPNATQNTASWKAYAQRILKLISLLQKWQPNSVRPSKKQAETSGLNINLPGIQSLIKKYLPSVAGNNSETPEEDMPDWTEPPKNQQQQAGSSKAGLAIIGLLIGGTIVKGFMDSNNKKSSLNGVEKEPEKASSSSKTKIKTYSY